MKKDHFVTLGLAKGATEPEIRRAYRQLALRFHPDKNNEINAEEMFKEISEAYKYLLSDVTTERRNINNEKETNFREPKSKNWGQRYDDRRCQENSASFRTFFDGHDTFRERYWEKRSNSPGLNKSHSNKPTEINRKKRTGTSSVFSAFRLKVGLILTKYRPKNMVLAKIYDIVLSSNTLKVMIAIIVIVLCLPI